MCQTRVQRPEAETGQCEPCSWRDPLSSHVHVYISFTGSNPLMHQRCQTIGAATLPVGALCVLFVWPSVYKCMLYMAYSTLPVWNMCSPGSWEDQAGLG